MLGESPTLAAHPPGDGQLVDGLWVESGREVATLPLTIEPMSKGSFVRSLGEEGDWTGGGISCFSTTKSLTVSSDINQTTASWVFFDGLWYAVYSVAPWLKGILEHYEYTALLLRKQPETDPETGLLVQQGARLNG